MKRLVAPLLLLLVGAAFGADATTKPTTRPAWSEQVVSNPDVETIVNNVPKHLLPPTDGSKDDMPTRIKSLREWNATNLDGKPVKVVAFIRTGQTASFYVDGKPDLRIDITPVPANGAFAAYQRGDKITIEGKFGKGGLLVSRNGGITNFYFTVKDFNITKADK